MVITVDIGNSNTVIVTYEGSKKTQYRFETVKENVSTYYYDKFIDLLQVSLIELNEVEDEDYKEFGLGIEVHEVGTILKYVNKESFFCNFGPIKKRFSNTVGYSYISNGCVSCGALQGSFYYHEIMNDPKFCSKPVKIEESFGFLKFDFNPWILK